MARTTIREALAPGQVITDTGQGSGRVLLQLISPGWGSSGYYSQEVLEQAGKDKVWAAGTHAYLDHPTESESFERPERSVRDLAAVTTEDAYWNGTALVAEAKVFGPYRELVTEMADSIGMSIRGTAEGETGEAEGRTGIVFTRLVEGHSVDFVTKAGRGGRVLAVLESARARNFREASADQRREELTALVRDEHGGERVWVYVVDYDDTARTVVFQIENGDETGYYRQSYEVSESDVATALTGGRVEVRRVVTYTPVNTVGEATSVPTSPAGQSTATESHKEDTMASIQVEESRLAQLEQDAGRAPVLESENTTLKADLAEAHREADTAKAEAIIASADVEFDDLQKAGLLANLPKVAESGRLDADAFKTTVAEAAAKVAEAQGAGRVHGVGNTFGTGTTAVAESDIDKAVASAFGRTVKEA